MLKTVCSAKVETEAETTKQKNSMFGQDRNRQFLVETKAETAAHKLILGMLILIEWKSREKLLGRGELLVNYILAI